METLDVLITHSHGSARVLGHEASQWKRPKFDPSPHQNPLNQSSPKFARVITSWTATAFQNFLPIGSGLSVRSPNTWFWRAFRVFSFSFCFLEEVQ